MTPRTLLGAFGALVGAGTFLVALLFAEAASEASVVLLGLAWIILRNAFKDLFS